MASTSSPAAPSRRRWSAAPALAVVLLAVAAAAPAVAGGADGSSGLTGASAARRLAALAPVSASELVARVIGARWGNLSGTVSWHPRLGLPDIGLALGGGLLSGRHRFGVSVGDQGHFRVVMSGPFAETDLLRNGPDLWLWQSDRLRVTHATLAPAGSAPSGVLGLVAGAVGPTLIAGRLLDALRPSTVVSVADPAVVAGRAAYQLAFAPRAPGSLIGEVLLAVDADSGLPLRVQVFARDRGAPAIEVAFSALHRLAPGVGRRANASWPGGPPAAAHSAGSHYRPLPGIARHEARSAPELLSAVLASPPSARRPATVSRPQVIGEGWARVVVARLDPTLLANGAAAVVLSQAPTLQVPGLAARHGRARLLATALLDALILDDGTVYAGAVTPEVLAAYASRDR